jgi:hypothetical protein
MFDSLLSKKWFQSDFQGDNFIVSKSDMLVGKDYLYDGIFKISEKTIITNNEINNKPISSYLSFFYTINLELLPTTFFLEKLLSIKFV